MANRTFVPLYEIPFATAEFRLPKNAEDANFQNKPVYFNFQDSSGAQSIRIDSSFAAYRHSAENSYFLSELLNQGLIDPPAGIPFTANPENVDMLKMQMKQPTVKSSVSNINYDDSPDNMGVDDLDVNGITDVSASNEHNNDCCHLNELYAQIGAGLETASPNAFELDQYVDNVDVLPSLFATTTRRNVYSFLSRPPADGPVLGAEKLAKTGNAIER